jgi:hypothetical protein
MLHGCTIPGYFSSRFGGLTSVQRLSDTSTSFGWGGALWACSMQYWNPKKEKFI